MHTIQLLGPKICPTWILQKAPTRIVSLKQFTKSKENFLLYFVFINVLHFELWYFVYIFRVKK